jgi:hypothetical protein
LARRCCTLNKFHAANKISDKITKQSNRIQWKRKNINSQT